MPIKFGTDGWRAVISDEFTFENVRRVAQGIADVANQDGTGKQLRFVIGFDTRFLSDRYAIEVSRVLAANGIQVLLCNADAPTPVVSYAVKHNRADGGVMITASHNPPRYNGIKLKAAYGGSASPVQCKRVESQIAVNEAANKVPAIMSYETALEEGLVSRFDPAPAYREHIRQLINLDAIGRAGLRVVVDPMYGAGRGYLRDLLSSVGVEVQEIRGEMNPGFNGIHPEPIARHLQPLMNAVVNGRFDIGLATDGDADRIGAVTAKGHFLDPHCVFSLALRYLVEVRGLRGSVVKTVSTTQMLNRLAQRYGLPLHETPVGFNHISDLMLADSVLIGGEESGGISIQGHIPEGDGILMGLLLTEIVAHSGLSLDELLSQLMGEADIGPFHYARHDFRLDEEAQRRYDKSALVAQLTAHPPQVLAGMSIIQVSSLDGVKYTLSDESWLLIRPSGTEPILRVYAEARTPEMVSLLLQEGQSLSQSC